MATWPSSLPAPLLANYVSQAGEAVIRTNMDAGRVRMRRRFTTVPDKITVAWYFTPLQLAIFRAWWEQQIAAGAGAFTLSLRIDEAHQTVTARFLGAYKASRQEAGFRVDGTLEVEGATTMDSATLAGYL